MEIPAGSGKLGPSKFAVAAVFGALGMVAGEIAASFLPPNIAAAGFWRINVAKTVLSAGVLVGAGVGLALVRK